MKTFAISSIFAAIAVSGKDMPVTEDFPPELDMNDFAQVTDFYDKGTKGDTPWFVEMYAPWCPHCQRLAPTWDDFYRRNRDTLNVARVDCTSKAG